VTFGGIIAYRNVGYPAL